MVDLQNSLLEVADHSVQMLTASKVALIPRQDIIKLTLERPTVGLAMWKETLVDASIFREWVANIGRRDARTPYPPLRVLTAAQGRRTWRGRPPV